MKISIKTIPHVHQRYNTVGDWWWDEEGTLQIRVSEMGRRDADWKSEVCVAIHEAVEALLCSNVGVTGEEVTKFDMNYHAEGEPGASPDAPYHNEHMAAENVERMVAYFLRCQWDTHDTRVNQVSNTWPDDR